MTETVHFTADTHFFHEKILWLGNGRPFDTVEEMNERLVENWNARVAPGDRVYHLGDVSFGKLAQTEEVLRRLNGRLYLVRGNHDNRIDGLEHLFEWVGPYKTVTVAGQKIVLFHFPIAEWDRCHRGSWHLHGHQHGNGEAQTIPRLDVGVDPMLGSPVSFEQVREIMRGREWEPLSHH